MTTSGSASLVVDTDSFRGDVGSFSGLDPVRMALSVRNVGPVAIQPADNFTARVALSTDDTFSVNDFILREFDLGGAGLGANLLPNETISLDWVQQLPDNLEGDYYLLFNILETGQNFSLQNTPTITLTSFNDGITMMVDTNGTNSNIERPSTSIDGKIVAYEATEMALGIFITVT